MASWVCCDHIVCAMECEPEFQIKIYEPNMFSAFVEFSIPQLAALLSSGKREKLGKNKLASKLLYCYGNVTAEHTVFP